MADPTTLDGGATGVEEETPDIDQVAEDIRKKAEAEAAKIEYHEQKAKESGFRLEVWRAVENLRNDFITALYKWQKKPRRIMLPKAMSAEEMESKYQEKRVP
ncbi:MAG: hypothetical protein KAS77_04680, partial [Thermoplasmata archaeon]|nr:hypothetical protein [Thermoplasmata archaeon]